jgi:hypothetical protein
MEIDPIFQYTQDFCGIHYVEPIQYLNHISLTSYSEQFQEMLSTGEELNKLIPVKYKEMKEEEPKSVGSGRHFVFSYSKKK